MLIRDVPAVAAAAEADADAGADADPDAGLIDVETRTISVQRTYASFEEFWRIAQTGPRVAPRVAAMTPADVALLQDRLRARWVADDTGRIICSARANAVKGRVARR